MRVREMIRRAFSSFLAVPTAVIVFFLLLAGGVDALDRSSFAWLSPARGFMQRHVFADAESTSSLLATIAGGMITITSITFSLLLLALQQSASSLTPQILDQFLRRRLNQLYFGYFVGLTLYALIILATVDPPFNPVIGATLAIVLTVVALYMLLLLISSTISQMRPTEIIRSIHDHTIRARQRQIGIVIDRTQREPAFPVDAPHVEVAASQNGYVVGFDLDRLGTEIEAAAGRVEVVFLIPVGSYVAFGDPVAKVSAERPDEGSAVANLLRDVIQIQRSRQLDTDPGYGIEQMTTIAWRSISTSQQNPAPGLAVIRNLRDLLARWSAESREPPEAEGLPIVYDDDVMSQLLSAFELLAVVASEAMQPQTCAEILRTFAITFARLPSDAQARAEDLVLRTISTLGDQVLTAELDAALIALASALDQAGRYETALSLRQARAELATTVGNLNSRATRVPSAR